MKTNFENQLNDGDYDNFFSEEYLVVPKEYSHIKGSDAINELAEYEEQRFKDLYAPVLVESPGKRFVTASTQNDSARRLDMLMQDSPDIKSIIDKYNASQSFKDNLEIVDFIRKSPDIRLDLGKFAYKKLQALAVVNKLPDRLVRNTEKAPRIADQFPNSGKVSSLEYASQLYLKMIDGSYDMNWHGDGKISVNNVNGEVIDGQHRAGALICMSQRIFQEELKLQDAA